MGLSLKKKYFISPVFFIGCIISVSPVLTSDSNSRDTDVGAVDGQQLKFRGGTFGPPSKGFGNFSGFFNCRPFNRTFVKTGLPCRRPNNIALNCHNETCICTSITMPTPPFWPGAGGFPKLLPLPNPPNQLQLYKWNCTSSIPFTTTPPTTMPPVTSIPPRTVPPITSTPPSTIPPDTSTPPSTMSPDTSPPPSTMSPDTSTPHSTMSPDTSPPSSTIPP